MKPDNDVIATNCYDNTGRLLYIAHFRSYGLSVSFSLQSHQ